MVKCDLKLSKMCTFADLNPGSKGAKKCGVVKQVTVECNPYFAQITLSAMQHSAKLGNTL